MIFQPGRVLGSMIVTAMIGYPVSGYVFGLGHSGWLAVLILILTICIHIAAFFKAFKRGNQTIANQMTMSRRLAKEFMIESTDNAPTVLVDQIIARFTDAKREAHRMVALLHSVEEGVIVVDQNSRVVLINPAAESMALPSSNLIFSTRSLAQLGLSPVVNDIVDEARSCGATVRASLNLLGSSADIDAVAAPIYDPDEGQVIVVLHDVSDKVRANTMMRDFVSNLSHELRTPLASIQLMSETLLEDAHANRIVQQNLITRIHSEVHRLGELSREILSLSRLDAGLEQNEQTECDLHVLLADICERYEHLVKKASITLNMEASNVEGLVKCDQERLERAIGILLDNAIKFSGSGGRINLYASMDISTAKVIVEDNGVGIEAADLPRIFERFYKTDHSRAAGGTGLGLAIAKQIMLGLGGDIKAESGGTDRGSRFTLVFPASDEDNFI